MDRLKTLLLSYPLVRLGGVEPPSDVYKTPALTVVLQAHDLNGAEPTGYDPVSYPKT